MLPQVLLRASAHLEGERLVPHYFTVGDEPWLRILIEEYARFVGRKCVDLQARLREPLSARAPKTKLRIAILILDGLTRARATAVAPPKEVRAALFRAAAESPASRGAVLSSVAASFAVTELELESALFADLKSERRIAPLPVASLALADRDGRKPGDRHVIHAPGSAPAHRRPRQLSLTDPARPNRRLDLS